MTRLKELLEDKWCSLANNTDSDKDPESLLIQTDLFSAGLQIRFFGLFNETHIQKMLAGSL